MSKENNMAIVINGDIPLSEYVRAMEEEEKAARDRIKSKELQDDTATDIKTMKRSLYFRPKFVVSDIPTKVVPTRTTHYTINDQIRYLLEKGKNQELLDVFSSLPPTKQRQIGRLLLIFRRVNSAKTTQVAHLIKMFKDEDVAGDPNRFLILLEQAGVITMAKEHHSNRREFQTEANDEISAVSLLVRNYDRLIGYGAPVGKKRVKLVPGNGKSATSKPLSKEAVIEGTKEILAGATVPTETEQLCNDMKQSFKIFKTAFPNLDIETFAQLFIDDRFKRGAD